MYIHLKPDNKTDPRVLRTKQLLINSFAKLLIEHKSIRKISVQSVTNKAGVNRVTFYAHFTDKYDLLETWAHLMFRQSIADKLPENANLSSHNLNLLITAASDFFVMRSQYQRRINEQFEPIFESAIQQELQAILESMLESNTSDQPSASDQEVAIFLSWAIFGSLLTWSRTPNNKSKDQLVIEISSLSLMVLK